MNHKRGRSKNQRAGCLMCKPNKMSGWPKGKLGMKGFGALRKRFSAGKDMNDELKGSP